MTDVKVQTNGRLNIFWVPEGGIAKPSSPTEAEMAAAIDLSPGIVWDSLTIGSTGTNEIDDRGILDAASKTDAGSIQYGATVPYFYPANITDVNDDYAKVRNIFKVPRVKGFLIVKLLQNTKGVSAKPVAGNWVGVYKVQADVFAHDTEGEDSYKFTIEYLAQGFASVYALVSDGTASVIPSTVPTLTPIGAKDVITATYLGKDVTQGATWRSSNSGIVSVSPNGVVVRRAAGTATITVDHPASKTPATVVIAA